MRIWVGALIAAVAALLAVPGLAQSPGVRVGAPAGVLAQVVEDLGRVFAAQTGIAVEAVALGDGPVSPKEGLDAVLRPGRQSPGEGTPVFFGEGVLVGSRADRARVRGLRDIKAALRWIAAARAIYVSSSPSLGLRELELALWDEVGVNVRVRTTWYIEARGDEAAIFRQAAQWGAYALVQRGTFAAQEDRRGLEILVQGDPLLRTAYVSELLRPQSREAQAWHNWLASEDGRAALAAWRLNGVQVFTPAGDGQPGAPPHRT